MHDLSAHWAQSIIILDLYHKTIRFFNTLSGKSQIFYSSMKKLMTNVKNEKSSKIINSHDSSADSIMIKNALNDIVRIQKECLKKQEIMLSLSESKWLNELSSKHHKMYTSRTLFIFRKCIWILIDIKLTLSV